MGAFWGLLMPTVISVRTGLSVSSMLSACYCLGGRCVLKSLATSEYDSVVSSVSTTILCTPVCCPQHTGVNVALNYT